LGQREDIAQLLNGLDVLTLCSAYGEGFPNVVGEAMASGIPCVVTDVGDSAMIVGDTGRVVPIGNPEALAESWRALIGTGVDARQKLGTRARARIVGQFDLDKIVERYADLYQDLVRKNTETMSQAGRRTCL